MTENSNVYQNCQANQDCNFSIIGQKCLEKKCIFDCKQDSDCPSNGKCLLTNNCDWSGEPVPPLLKPSLLNTEKNLAIAAASSPNASGTETETTTSDSKLGSPLVMAAIVVTALVVFFMLVAILFCVFRRRRLAESSRGLKPLYLSGSRSSSSIKRSPRDSKEKERSSKKPHQHDDMLVEEESFETSYSPGAVGAAAAMGTPRVPVRSQTMYGTSTPSTVEFEFTGPQHHFMADPQYAEETEDLQQQQQHNNNK